MFCGGIGGQVARCVECCMGEKADQAEDKAEAKYGNTEQYIWNDEPCASQNLGRYRVKHR